jgi:signal peptidase II
MIPFSVLAAGLFLFDLITKTLVRKNLPFGAEIKILPFFSVVHVTNTGIAFGMLQDNNFALLVVGLMVVAAMVFMAWKTVGTDRPSAYMIALVVGGALGNLTDRFVFGHVTDFLDFYWEAHHWPAFNVADSAICVGATLLILRELTRKHHASNPR